MKSDLGGAAPETGLTLAQRRALGRFRRILFVAGLDAEGLLERAKDDPAAIVPVLKSMTEQVVRSQVITWYTWIDSALDDVLFTRVEGPRRKLSPGRRRRGHTLELILRRLYPLQKLTIIRKFRKVPKEIASSIAAIDELRNGLAHDFFVSRLPKHRRTYKGKNVFTPKGLEILKEDGRHVIAFFQPFLREFL